MSNRIPRRPAVQADAFDIIAHMTTEEQDEYEAWLAADVARWRADEAAQRDYESWLEEDAAARSGMCFPDDEPFTE